MLHLFSGRVDTAAVAGDTLDINPELEPTYCVNAETCEGVPLHLYDFVLADPPYSKADAQHYGTKLPASHKVMAALAAGLAPGAWVVWLDRRRPDVPEGTLTLRSSNRHREQHDPPVPDAPGIPTHLKLARQAGFDTLGLVPGTLIIGSKPALRSVI